MCPERGQTPPKKEAVQPRFGGSRGIRLKAFALRQSNKAETLPLAREASAPLTLCILCGLRRPCHTSPSFSTPSKAQLSIPSCH